MAGCCCASDKEITLVYACSGAANVGLLSDQVMRALNARGAADSTCLAALGAGLSGFQASAANATKNIVLDGCKVSCGRKVFEKQGLACTQLVMTDYGVEKGKTAITPELVEDVTSRIAASLQV